MSNQNIQITHAHPCARKICASLHVIAARYRRDYDLAVRDGVVIIVDGEAVGWVNELRDPHHWRPGCVAVDSDGNQWQASGGNNDDGAKQWELITEREAAA